MPVKNVAELMGECKPLAVLWGGVFVIYNQVLPVVFDGSAVLTEKIKTDPHIDSITAAVILVAHQANAVVPEDLF